MGSEILKFRLSTPQDTNYFSQESYMSVILNYNRFWNIFQRVLVPRDKAGMSSLFVWKETELLFPVIWNI